MTLPKKKYPVAQEALTSLQQAHLPRRARRPTQSHVFLATGHEQIRLQLQENFSTYIAADAEGLIDQVDSVICALRNEALCKGVSPTTRFDLNQLYQWKDLLSRS
jgi:hypothetical protein